METGSRRRVLFVCTANICRSPAAEYLARRHFGSDRFHVRSAGFLAAGRSCPEELQKALANRGVSVADHRSYTVDRDSLTAADIVFTMEARHVLDATVIDRRSLRKTLPLKEAAGAVGPDETFESFLARINADRDPHRYLSETRYDVSDPYKKRLKVYERAVEEIDGLVRTVLSRLR